jgi:hypothetical protein
MYDNHHVGISHRSFYLIYIEVAHASLNIWQYELVMSYFDQFYLLHAIRRRDKILMFHFAPPV